MERSTLTKAWKAVTGFFGSREREQEEMAEAMMEAAAFERVRESLREIEGHKRRNAEVVREAVEFLWGVAAVTRLGVKRREDAWEMATRLQRVLAEMDGEGVRRGE